ncbi:hypothetical protein BLNAU_7595 [Blattamonas nauphoetae]|uniref:Trichohyalin-like n=1 Tax=Blattamonas nauphoetae TaxID=2049346 RepID=A0ABQ9Y172_9EUKA|nr:hypothetical protein BLNAU_7595 [Blattamonas nauphoetae]
MAALSHNSRIDSNFSPVSLPNRQLSAKTQFVHTDDDFEETQNDYSNPSQQLGFTTGSLDADIKVARIESRLGDLERECDIIRNYRSQISSSGYSKPQFEFSSHPHASGYSSTISPKRTPKRSEPTSTSNLIASIDTSNPKNRLTTPYTSIRQTVSVRQDREKEFLKSDPQRTYTSGTKQPENSNMTSTTESPIHLDDTQLTDSEPDISPSHTQDFPTIIEQSDKERRDRKQRHIERVLKGQKTFSFVERDKEALEKKKEFTKRFKTAELNRTRKAEVPIAKLQTPFKRYDGSAPEYTVAFGITTSLEDAERVNRDNQLTFDERKYLEEREERLKQMQEEVQNKLKDRFKQEKEMKKESKRKIEEREKLKRTITSEEEKERAGRLHERTLLLEDIDVDTEKLEMILTRKGSEATEQEKENLQRYREKNNEKEKQAMKERKEREQRIAQTPNISMIGFEAELTKKRERLMATREQEKLDAEREKEREEMQKTVRQKVREREEALEEKRKNLEKEKRQKQQEEAERRKKEQKTEKESRNESELLLMEQEYGSHVDVWKKKDKKAFMTPDHTFKPMVFTKNRGNEQEKKEKWDEKMATAKKNASTLSPERQQKLDEWREKKKQQQEERLKQQKEEERLRRLHQKELAKRIEEQNKEREEAQKQKKQDHIQYDIVFGVTTSYSDARMNPSRRNRDGRPQSSESQRLDKPKGPIAKMVEERVKERRKEEKQRAKEAKERMEESRKREAERRRKEDKMRTQRIVDRDLLMDDIDVDVEKYRANRELRDSRYPQDDDREEFLVKRQREREKKKRQEKRERLERILNYHNNSSQFSNTNSAESSPSVTPQPQTPTRTSPTQRSHEPTSHPIRREKMEPAQMTPKRKQHSKETSQNRREREKDQREAEWRRLDEDEKLELVDISLENLRALMKDPRMTHRETYPIGSVPHPRSELNGASLDVSEPDERPSQKETTKSHRKEEPQEVLEDDVVSEKEMSEAEEEGQSIKDQSESDNYELSKKEDHESDSEKDSASHKSDNKAEETESEEKYESDFSDEDDNPF